MVEIGPIEEISENWVRGHVRHAVEEYIKGKKNLDRTMDIIERSGILRYEGLLLQVFSDLQSYEKTARYQEILKECQRRKWL